MILIGAALYHKRWSIENFKGLWHNKYRKRLKISEVKIEETTLKSQALEEGKRPIKGRL